MPGAVEMRITDLANEVFEPSDLVASALTPSLKARSASFLVLAHAEIEYAIETECRRTANLLRTSVVPTTAILAWGILTAINESASKKKPALQLIVDQYDHIISKNHGIKEANMNMLLLPLGVDMNAAKVDVSTLDSFGARRGDLAHQPLRNWSTTDLPSVHRTYGIQAGLAADQIIGLIKTGHSSIVPAPSPRLGLSKRLGRLAAKLLRATAALIDGS